MWNEFVDGFKEFFNQPVTIIVSTILTVLVCGLIFLKETSIGRKALKLLKLDYSNSRADYLLIKEEIKQNIQDFQEHKLEIEKEVKFVISQFEDFKTGLVDIIKEIPNKKVQDKLNGYLNEFNEKEQAMRDYFKNTYAQYQESMKNLELQKQAQIDHLKNEMESVKELLEKYIKVKESGENEQENTNTD